MTEVTMHPLKKAGLFVALTFGSSWVLAGAFVLAGGKLQSRAGLIMSLIYMFLPATMAVIVQKVICREELSRSLGISFKLNLWFLAAWLLPLAVALGAFGVALLMPGVQFAPGMEGMFARYQNLLTPEQVAQMKAQMSALPFHPFWFAALQGLIAGATINAVAAFGEELGWRGLLQKELGGLGFWRSSFIIGLIWGVWHAPLILQGHNYPQHPVQGVLFMIDFCFLYAPLLAWIRHKARSVIAASILHGTINGTYGVAIMLVSGGNDLSVGVTGLAGLTVLAVANLLLFAYDRFVAKEKLTPCAPEAA